MEEEYISFEKLPDTITPYDYAKWRRVGLNTARDTFNSKGFPRIKGAGSKQLADKTAVWLYDMDVKGKELDMFLEKIAEKYIERKFMKEGI